tara:strand:- start:1597 stop:2664 length:1068 start_codon:yes stop_codon:yes gene_type:complete
MSPFKSSAGRQLGKMLEGFKSSDIGKGFGGGGGGTVLQASGGEIALGTSATLDGTDYKYHYFRTPGTFLIPDADIFDEEIDVLVIAGGAAGGQRSGGGGGAGGIAVAENVPFGSTSGQLTIPITVGGGGSINNPGGQGRGNNGSDSRFAGPGDSWNVFALGGGGGGGDSPNDGASGGSGGGGHYDSSGGAGTQPNQNPGKSWVTNYGNAGNTGHGAPQHQSGAGGGAGSAALGGSSTQRGQAGDGAQLPIWGVSYYMPNTDPWWPGISPLPGTHFGGGGGAGDYPPYIPQRMPADATNGGGGIGGPGGGAGHGTPGVNGLGGGGGGAAGDPQGHNGGYGGSGMVVIRYRNIKLQA